MKNHHPFIFQIFLLQFSVFNFFFPVVDSDPLQILLYFLQLCTLQHLLLLLRFNFNTSYIPEFGPSPKYGALLFHILYYILSSCKISRLVLILFSILFNFFNPSNHYSIIFRCSSCFFVMMSVLAPNSNFGWNPLITYVILEC